MFACYNEAMKHVIQFHVYKGDKYYIAEGLDLPVVTQAKTLDELAKNIEEAVSLHLEGENPADYSLAPEPSVMLSLELGLSAHA